jgi:hypothetical protein
VNFFGHLICGQSFACIGSQDCEICRRLKLNLTGSDPLRSFFKIIRRVSQRIQAPPFGFIGFYGGIQFETEGFTFGNLLDCTDLRYGNSSHQKYSLKFLLLKNV